VLDKKLISLNTAEFSYAFLSYGIGSTLVLYLTEVLHLTDFEALSSLSIQSCLVYSLPIMVAFLSDRFMSREMLVFSGLLFMALGFTFFACAPKNYITFPLSFITVGYVLGRPTVPILMNQLVPSEQNRRAISILYAVSNVAYVLAPLVFALSLGKQRQNLFLGLGLGAFFISFVFFRIFINRLSLGHLHHLSLGVGICLGLVFIVNWFLNAPQRLKYFFFSAVLMALFYFWRLFSQATPETFQKIIKFCAAFVIACLFFSIFSQQYFFMPLYIERYVDRSVFSFEIPTPWFNACNPFFVVTLSFFLPKFTKEMNRLDSIAPLSFAFTGIGFLFLMTGTWFSGIQALSIVISYFFLAIAELTLVPFVLSMISTWDTEKEKSTLMGLWYLSMAFAKIIASKLALWIDISKDLQNSFSPADYSNLFFWMGMSFIGASFFVRFILKYLFTTFKGLHSIK